ncbi:MAG: AsmA family protein, partial [Chitinophagales bacterium]
MNKYLKYTLFGFGSLIGLILLLAISIPLLFENRIKSIFISSLNKNLATEVIINEDDIHLSILKTFPYAAVSFQNIGIRESMEGSDAYFLTASEISLAFNLRDIIRKKYDIKKLIISDAHLQLKEDANGIINYKFWKPTDGETHTEFNIHLSEIIINNTEITYLDYSESIDLNLLIHNANATGNFSSAAFSVKTKANVLSRHIHVNNAAYLTSREVNLDCLLAVDTKNNTYTFSKSSVIIDKNKFGITGNFTAHNGTDYHLQFDGRDVNIEALMISMPASYGKALHGLQSKGNLTFQAKVEGKYSATSKPQTFIRFDLQKGTLYHAQFNDKLTDVAFSGFYSNGAKQNRTTSMIQLKNFKAKYRGENINGNFQLQNFANPEIDFSLNGIVPASLIIPMLDNSVSDVTGQIQFEQLQFKGSIATLQQGGISQNPPSGKAGISDVAFNYKNETIKIASADLILSNAELQVQQFFMTLPGTDFSGNITLGNWSGLLNDRGNNGIISVSGKLESKKMDVKQLHHYFSSGTETATQPGNPSGNRHTPVWMQLSGPVEIEIQELAYGTFLLHNIRSTLRCNPLLLSARAISAQTQNGTAQLSATFRLSPSGNYILETTGVLNYINITEMFKQLNNFGQTTLTYENISGIATLLIENITIGFNPEFQVIEESV